MADLRTPGGSPGADEQFERLLRVRLHMLADHAPTMVRSIDEIAVVHATRRTERPARRRRIAGIGATIGTLAAGLGLTTLALNGAGEPGASSPEAAVTRFVDALEAEDVVGMIDILDPAEVPAARAAVQTAKTEGERVGLVSGGLSLDDVDGVDVEVADLSLSTTRIFADVAVVTAESGTASISFDPDTFPLGDSLAGFFDRSSMRGSALAELGGDDVPVQIATVERDGRWYVSTTYTIAEYLRFADDRPAPTDVAALVPAGHASAEEAATAWYQDLIGFDLERAAQLAAPGAGDAVLRYANVWLPSAADDLARLHDEGWNLTIGDLTFEASGDDGVRTLRPLTFHIAGTTSASTFAQPTLDPDLPTVVYTYEGGFAVVPAGQPLPATIDDLEIETDYAVLDDSGYNSTSSDESGAISPMFLPDDVPADPLPIDVTYADGCVTWSGAAVDQLFANGFPSTSIEMTADGSYRGCDTAFGLVGLLALPFASGEGGLPSVTVQEVGGQWYVSPVGTLAGVVLDLMRGVPEGGGVFDSELGLYVYGTNRASLASMLAGLRLDEVWPECRPIVADDGAVVTGLVDDPDLAQVRACWNDGFLGMAAGTASAPVVVSGGGGVTVATEPAVPETAVPTTVTP